MRVAFAAAHVAAGLDGAIDWRATLDFRHHLWQHGLGVAEAMDTAQRGMGLDWPTARELIRRSAAERGGRLAAGAGTDHAEPRTLDEVRAAYEHQCEFVEGTGAQAIVMASRALAAVARGPDDYREVYGAILRQLERPAILHWLGDMFDPALAGYWGVGRPRRGDRHRCWRSSPSMPTRSTASRSRCSTPSARSPSGNACRRASASTPATTSTTRS